MKTYKALNKQVYLHEPYSLVPIRMEDRYDIMQWRNEQIEILRQKELLSKENQDIYFDTIIAKLFEKEKPEQLIFSLLNRDELVGYGGLVHIDWLSKHAEISFLLKTSLNNEKYYLTSGKAFFYLIEKVAEDAGLNKIYTYGYDLVNYRFKPLYTNGFILEAYLHEHILVKNEKKAVRIYSKFLRND